MLTLLLTYKTNIFLFALMGILKNEDIWLSVWHGLSHGKGTGKLSSVTYMYADLYMLRHRCLKNISATCQKKSPLK